MARRHVFCGFLHVELFLAFIEYFYPPLVYNVLFTLSLYAVVEVKKQNFGAKFYSGKLSKEREMLKKNCYANVVDAKEREMLNPPVEDQKRNTGLHKNLNHIIILTKDTS